MHQVQSTGSLHFDWNTTRGTASDKDESWLGDKEAIRWWCERQFVVLRSLRYVTIYINRFWWYLIVNNWQQCQAEEVHSGHGEKIQGNETKLCKLEQTSYAVADKKFQAYTALDGTSQWT